jgi:hypothetical protein
MVSMNNGNWISTDDGVVFFCNHNLEHMAHKCMPLQSSTNELLQSNRISICKILTRQHGVCNKCCGTPDTSQVSEMLGACLPSV